MTPEAVSDIVRDALFVVINASAPVLLVSLVIGLVVSIFQTVTSIQEQTLTFVPKILGIFLTIILMGQWMMETMTTFLENLWSNFSIYIR